jgi:hypothetical protein
VSVQSEGANLGSEFIVELPAQQRVDLQQAHQA